MSSKEELDNSIVDAIDTYKKAKRQELVQAVKVARAAWDAECSGTTWVAFSDASAALWAYDKENTK